MNELRIFDRWSKDDRLLTPLSVLLRVLLGICPEKLRGEWKLLKGAYGYGEKVCEIEDSLAGAEFVKVDGQNLRHLLAENEQYFDNARITVPSSGLEFGIHDSTFLYVKGDRTLLDEVAAEFRDTDSVESS
jgi:hypothetical protein